MSVTRSIQVRNNRIGKEIRSISKSDINTEVSVSNRHNQLVGHPVVSSHSMSTCYILHTSRELTSRNLINYFNWSSFPVGMNVYGPINELHVGRARLILTNGQTDYHTALVITTGYLRVITGKGTVS